MAILIGATVEEAIPPAIADRQELLRAISQINCDFLRLISSPEFVHSYKGRRFLGALAPHMDAMSADSIAYAQNFPFLLIDLRFAEPHWWHRDAACNALEVRDECDLPSGVPERLFPLVRAVMTMALYLSKSERDTALLLLGLAPEVVDLLAQRGILEIDGLAAMGCRLVRPRWVDSPAVWSHLLTRDYCSTSTSIQRFVLHALQLSTVQYEGSPRPRKPLPQLR